jgi:CHAT domain-containing protein
LSYAASENIFQLTGGRKRTADHRNIRAWIIANPTMPPVLEVCQSRQELKPLLGAQTEGEEIRRTLGADRVELFIGEEADRLRLEAWHPNFTIVHFATHGIVCPYDPLSSTLVLADLNGKQLNIDHASHRLLWTKGLFHLSKRNLNSQDFPVYLQDMDRIDGDPLKDFYYRGTLTARDILSHFNLEADLVVLSACRTALGKLMGEGMIGFTRAFMATGARSVLVSLWRVDDWATEALMVAFYKEYARHGNKGLALQIAMQTVRERYTHPKHWAAFSLFGPAE